MTSNKIWTMISWRWRPAQTRAWAPTVLFTQFKHRRISFCFVVYFVSAVDGQILRLVSSQHMSRWVLSVPSKQVLSMFIQLSSKTFICSTVLAAAKQQLKISDWPGDDVSCVSLLLSLVSRTPSDRCYLWTTVIPPNTFSSSKKVVEVTTVCLLAA